MNSELRIQQDEVLYSFFLAFLCGILFFSILPVRAQNLLDEKVVTERVREWFNSAYQSNLKTYKARKDILVRPGIVASRKTRTVEILAVACGLSKRDPAEFLLVAENGRDYEALTMTIAKPSDVHAALTFIGVEPGHPIQPTEFRFWPKGERVDIQFNWEVEGKRFSVPAEQMIFDTRAKKTLPRTGWMFDGSRLAEGKAKPKYLADEVGDIISDFNSRWTVLDVPYQATQGAVYGALVPNPDYLLKLRQQVRIIIKPQLPKGQKRVLDYHVLVTSGKAEGGLAFSITGADGHAVLAQGSFKEFLGRLQQNVKAKKDIYLQLVFHDQAAIPPLLEFGALIQTLIKNNLIRIEPAPQQLFYESFLSKPGWRDPKKRLVQPIELFFAHGKPAQHLFRYYQEEYLDSGDVKLHEKKYQFKTTDELKKILATKKEWDTRTVFFYARPETPYGVIRQYYLLLNKSFPTAYIFAEKPE